MDEKNKSIVTFMGWEFFEGVWINDYTDRGFGRSDGPARLNIWVHEPPDWFKERKEKFARKHELTFVTNGIELSYRHWGKLMTVVTKITDMDAVTEFDINYDSVFGARAQIVPAYKDSFQIITVKEKSMRKATFEAVSEFAEWYNRNTK